MSLWWDAVRLRCCRDRPQLARLRRPSQGDQHDDCNQPDGDRDADPDEKPAHRALRLLPAANEPRVAPRMGVRVGLRHPHVVGERRTRLDVGDGPRCVEIPEVGPEVREVPIPGAQRVEPS